MSANDEKDQFLYPRNPYHGEFKPENLVFNANLQEFAQRVSFLCNLETAGKIKPGEAYRQIKEMWKQLKMSKKALGIDDEPLDTNPDDSGDSE
jgi:hypothetical protein